MAERRTLVAVLFSLYLILLATLAIGGHGYYRGQQQRYENEIRNQLLVIADLKVAQISAWRKERLEDGALVQHHFGVANELRRMLSGSQAVSPGAAVVDWMQAMKDHRGFQNVTLVDAHGAIRFSLLPQARLAEPCMKVVREVMASRQVTLSDIHRENETASSHLSVAVPILVPDQQTPIGVILLWTDPNLVLYPLIQSWLTPSRSAEVLLVRQEGDQVLFLNELRHRKDTAMKFRLPIGDAAERTPAAAAVSGREGLWSGLDYRGIPVLVAARRIPESPWHLIAKIDIEEVETPVHQRAVLVSIVLLLTGLAAGPAIGLVWYQQRSRVKRVQRESETARHALLGHFSYLSRHANDIILLELESGQIIEANQRAEQTYGYDHEELLNLNIRDLIDRASLEEFDSKRNAMLHRQGSLYETRHRRKDGSVFPVEVSARVIEVDGRSFRQSIIRDITERKNDEERLRRAAAYNRRLIEAALDPLVTIAPDGTITDVNTATEKVTGYPREQLVGTDFSDYFTDPVRAREGYQQAFREGQIQDYELEIRHRDGALTPVIYSASVYRDKAGDVVGVFAAARDISERKRIHAEIQEINQELEQRVRQRTAELEAANKELEAFTYSVSHDLRAPLRAVNGFSRMLEERYAPQLSPEARHYLEVVRQSAVQMGRLVDDLLALSRLGRQALKTQTLAPGGLVRQAMEELSGEREGRQIEFVVGELPPCEADPALLKQVFVNLLSNALKYSRRRETARIEVASSRLSDLKPTVSDGKLEAPSTPPAGPDSCVYYVRDNGAGFDMRYVGKLFGVFQRLHSQGEFEGSGVGLAIVERIIRRHGGHVWAEAEVDKGATFYFTIGEII